MAWRRRGNCCGYGTDFRSWLHATLDYVEKFIAHQMTGWRLALLLVLFLALLLALLLLGPVASTT
jgi:hypothetical protein